MKCPYCTKEVEIPERAYYNVETYRDTVLTRTDCCGRGVKLACVTRFLVFKHPRRETEDDWGLSIISERVR